MKYTEIRRYLKPYGIVASRKTTINHAFAAAIAPNDKFDDGIVRRAIELLGQDPDTDLKCAYCGAIAETWDHVHGTVKESYFSGYGHRVGNLLPCCKPCNSKKGNKNWKTFLDSLGIADAENQLTTNRIGKYLDDLCVMDTISSDMPEYEFLLSLRKQVLELLALADEVAKVIRTKALKEAS